MTNFIGELDAILKDSKAVKKMNLKLDDEVLTRAIDAILPDPNNSNPNFQINHVVVLDIEYFTLANTDISQFGFVPTDSSDKVANFAREIAMLILERVTLGESYFWTIKRLIFFNTNNEYIYKTLYFMRQNYAKSLPGHYARLPYASSETLLIKGPYMRLVDSQFMTVNEYEFDNDLKSKLSSNQIKNRSEFINKLQDVVGTPITSDNYLGYSDHRYYHTNSYLTKYHDAIMDSYINNIDVKGRELSALETLNVLKLLKDYERKICVVNKGTSDIKAINNTYRLFSCVDTYKYLNGKFQLTVNSYKLDRSLEINFKNNYDIAYFNGMSHILYKSAKLNVTCHNLITSKFYKENIEGAPGPGMQSFRLLISMLKDSKPHDPKYDVMCTIITAILVHLSTLMSFS
jgi:hypothetical protein